MILQTRRGGRGREEGGVTGKRTGECGVGDAGKMQRKGKGYVRDLMTIKSEKGRGWRNFKSDGG